MQVNFSAANLMESRQLGTFLAVLDILTTKYKPRGWSFAYRQSSPDLNTLRTTIFRGTGRPRESWHTIEDPHCDAGTKRKVPRQLVCAEVANAQKNQFFYLLEMQLSSDEAHSQATILVYRHDFSQMDDDTFADLLRLTVWNNRWPSPDTPWKDSRHARLAGDFFKTMFVDRLRHPRGLTSKNAADEASRKEAQDRYVREWSDSIHDALESIRMEAATGKFVALPRLQ